MTASEHPDALPPLPGPTAPLLNGRIVRPRPLLQTFAKSTNTRERATRSAYQEGTYHGFAAGVIAVTLAWMILSGYLADLIVWLALTISWATGR